MHDQYVNVKPQENCGMCGYLWQTIRGIYHNQNKKYYIDFSNSIYRCENENVWDLFFYQTHIDTKPNNENIEKEVGIIFDQESEFIWNDTIPNTMEEISNRRKIFGSIVQKYFKLKPNIQFKIDSFVKKHFNNKKVMAVHFRGTDHPEKKTMDEYLQQIKKYLPFYDVVFVSSDEYERFRLAEIALSHKIVSYDSLRSDISNKPLHSHKLYSYGRNNNPEYQHKIAEDVIIEAYLMSKSDFLVCCSASNVNYFARAINSNLECVEL